MWEGARDDEVGFVAGMFEGEGCISIRQERSGYFLTNVQITSTDHDVLERILGIVGEGHIYALRNNQANSKWKPCETWRIHKQELVWEFLDKVEPLLGRRRLAKINEARRKAKANRKRRCPVCKRVFTASRKARCSDECEREFQRTYMREYRRDYRKGVLRRA